MKQKYDRSRIERLEVLENKLEIELSAVGATVDDEDEITVEIVGEVLAPSGLSVDVEIVAVLYDADGDAMARESKRFYADEFSGFDTFWLYASDLPAVPERIRVYPTKS